MIGFLVYLLILTFFVSIMTPIIKILCLWHFFEKEGRKGWYSLIPYYNIYQQYDLFWIKSLFWFDLVFSIALPFLTIIIDSSASFLVGIVWIVKFIMRSFLAVRTAKHYGHGILFGLGMVFIPFFFYPYLALTTT